jgi:hypothetical protein
MSPRTANPWFGESVPAKVCSLPHANAEQNTASCLSLCMAVEPPRPSPPGIPTPQPPFPKVPPLPDEPVIPDVPVRDPDEEVDDANPPRPKDIPIDTPPEQTP